MFARAELRKQIILDLKIHGGEDETALPTFHMGISSQHGGMGFGGQRNDVTGVNEAAGNGDGLGRPSRSPLCRLQTTTAHPPPSPHHEWCSLFSVQWHNNEENGRQQNDVCGSMMLTLGIFFSILPNISWEIVSAPILSF